MAAAFPSQIATDNNLIVADDRASSTLLGGISSGVTTIVVTSGIFSSNSVVTIENERILLGTETVDGTYTGCTRGYDNSTAASHLTGVSVRANVVAAHHNVLRQEIQAIETSLGANLSFVQKILNPNGFTFTHTGNQPLTGATPASVIITPSPRGITAFSANRHYLYITDGGSSEAVLLTSISVGASSTTVGFTPASSHTSGQWTLGSATGGIQEAVQYAIANGGGGIQMPYGTTLLYQRIFLGDVAVSTTLVGARTGSAIVMTGDFPAIYARGANQYWALQGFGCIFSPASTTAIGIDVSGCSGGNPTIDNVGVSGGLHAASIVSSSGLSILNSSFSAGASTGLFLSAVNTSRISGNSFNFNTTGAGLTIADGCSALIVRENMAISNTDGFSFEDGLTSIDFGANLGANNTGQDFKDSATSRVFSVLGQNTGSDTVAGAVTAAASIALPSTLTKTITISGTTTINTITGFWGTGHEVVFLCPNALTFSAAGNIKVALTTTYANQPVYARYNATDLKWYVS